MAPLINQELLGHCAATATRGLLLAMGLGLGARGVAGPVPATRDRNHETVRVPAPHTLLHGVSRAAVE